MTDTTTPSAQERYADWPQKGSEDPQPWDFKELGIAQPGVDRPQLDPGAPDDVSPVVPRAGLPLLVEGSQGRDVRDIAVRLGELGYPNSVTEGTNPYAILDGSVSAAVQSFRRDYNVSEDPSQFPRDPQAARGYCGPWTAEAIVRASDRERAA